MKPKVGLITLGVRDLAASLRFYRDGLGWPTHKYNPEADIVFFALEGTWLALYPRDKLWTGSFAIPDPWRVRVPC